jgi:hypothetical protein
LFVRAARFLAVLAVICASRAPAWPATPLTILNSLVRDIEDGPAVPPGFSFVPGQFLYISFEVTGYQASAERKIHLTGQMDALDPQGVKLVETLPSEVEAALADEDKNWKPKIREQVLIPPLAGSGSYKVEIRIKDELNGQTATKEVVFLVRGRDVAPSDTLVVRNFHFYRGEDDPNPLPVAAYRPGDTLWARFDIIGYKFGPGNAVDVDYGIAVLGPDGKAMYSKPEAAVEKSSSFYPKAYVPGGLNLSLQSTIRHGQYAIALTAHDRVGNQTVEVKETFSIE